MTTHELKVHPQFWDALVSGAKPFDVRRDDRKFKVGDTCLLREYDPSFGFKSTTSVAKRVTYVLAHEDLPAAIAVGHVALGFGSSEFVRCGWLQSHRDERTEFSPNSLGQADVKDGWTQDPVYRVKKS